ncbi:hypothetical protein AVEN_242660-1 [Araneus ventricosus]|uniref:Uncharacterized protein n=1 Tax=Araneus ventricosus TaxID=182803 RepID=A0A4Y2I8J4_ARAVE|nr:hypothetical protein AVEN_242660-1 [Araneus ventricosus]
MDISDSSSLDLNFLKSDKSIQEEIKRAANNGVASFTFFCSAINRGIPRCYPKNLKDDFCVKITSPRNIELLKMARQDKILCTTKSPDTAFELSKIDKILSIPVKCTLQYENISSRFLFPVIPSDTLLQEIAEEIKQENDLSVKEIRRFIKRTNGTVLPSDKVLVTTYGTSLPPEIHICQTTKKNSLIYKQSSNV